jgi:PAS domain S-box-containing protein
MRADVESRVSTAATGARAFTEQQMMRLSAVADNAARRHLLVGAVGSGTASDVDVAAVNDQLRQLRTLDPGISNAWLADASGRLVAVDPVNPATTAHLGSTFSYRDWYRGLTRTGHTYISETFQTATSPSARVVAVTTWVRDGSGRRVAVIGFSYDLSSLRSYTEMAQGQGVRLVLTDTRGVVLADPELAGNALVNRADDPRVAAARGGATGIAGEGSKEQFLSAYLPIRSLGWTVTAEVPKSRAFARLAELRRVVFGTAGVLGLALVFGTAMLLRLGARQQRSASALQASQQRFRSAFGDALIGMAIVDRDSHRFVSVNATLGQMLGKTEAELVGSVWEDFDVRDDLDPGREVICRDEAGEVISFRTRKRFPSPEGELVVDVRGALMRRDHGLSQHYVLQVLDITAAQQGARELREANARLEQQTADLAAARDLAEEASRLKSTFVANMSHEIRTPMNGVLGLTQLLSERDLPPAERELAALAHRSATALLAVLDDVLDFSKIEAGQLDTEIVDVDIRAVVDDVVRLFAAPAEERGLELSAAVAAEVPPLVSSDPTRLRQVLLNLVGNAVKFTERGNVRVDVTREAVLDRSAAVRFAVTDTGIGIAPETQQLLFEPFRQAEESTTRRFGGTGLGLAISSQLVVLLGGTLDVSSQPGVGSSFHFTLVLSSPAEPVAQTGSVPGDPATRSSRPVPLPRSAARFDAAPAETEGPRLLVAEDNLVNQKVAVGQLTSLGYRVDVVDDGLAAVEAVRTQNYAAVLMDCQMPRMDGYEATREIRRGEQEGRVPIIAVTASALASDRERCLAAGMDDHLGKPVRLPLLAQTLQRWVGGVGQPADGDSDGAAPTASAASPAPADPEELLDTDVLADLRTLPAEDLEVVLGDYVTTTEARLRALRTGMDEPVEFTRIAHSIKGSSASLAARRLASVAAELERMGRALLEEGLLLDRLAAEEVMDRLEREFVEVQPVLRTALLT